MPSVPIPSQFLVFIPSRKSVKDPYSGLILVNCELLPTNAHKLTFPPADDSQVWRIPDCLLEKHGTSHVWRSQGVFLIDEQTHMCHLYAIQKYLSASFTDLYAQGSANTSIPILEIGDFTKIFGKGHKRNVKIQLMSVPQGSQQQSQPQPQPQPSQNLPTTTPAVKPPKPAKKVLIPKTAAPAQGDLSPYVARQLLDLARMRKDQCPITAEEYIVGHTAVMPCGHLFMDMAIEETFKKERNRCPACRLNGRPTFV